jgi:hypothetical protein
MFRGRRVAGRGCVWSTRHFVDSGSLDEAIIEVLGDLVITLCIKLSKKVFLLEVECVGWSNSVRILSMVSRSDKTSVSDIHFSGNVGSTSCVDLPVLWNVSQDAIHFIVDVVFYKVTANHHQQKRLLLVPMRPRRLDILPI